MRLDRRSLLGGMLALPMAPRALAATGAALPTRALADGAIEVGNPKAAVKLTEWLSYTCPHCGHFTGEAEASLKRMIASGKLLVTFRPAVRDVLDLSATLLATGAGARFLPVHEAIFARQADWMGKAASLDGAALEKLSIPARLRRVADQVGLTAIATGAGLPTSSVPAAFAEARIAVITKAAQAAWSVIRGTPTFEVDGRRVDGSDWASLRAALGAAGLS